MIAHEIGLLFERGTPATFPARTKKKLLFTIMFGLVVGPLKPWTMDTNMNFLASYEEILLVSAHIPYIDTDLLCQKIPNFTPYSQRLIQEITLELTSECQ
jgi:hypothetical protein